MVERHPYTVHMGVRFSNEVPFFVSVDVEKSTIGIWIERCESP